MYGLYYLPGACSLAPNVVLEEVGEPFELARVPAVSDESKTQTLEYRAINLKGRVPALTVILSHSGGTEGVLTEVGAILVYLVEAS